MRRSMLTVGAPAAVFTPMGTSAVLGSGGFGNIVWSGVQATVAGTVTSCSAYMSVTGDYAFFTIDTSHVVRAISDTFSAVGSGVFTQTVSLAAQPGDRIGVWRPNTCQVNGRASTGNTLYTRNGSFAKPSPGDTLTPTGTNANFGACIVGTGV